MKQVIAILLFVLIELAHLMFAAGNTGNLEKYIKIGLQNNLALKQQEIFLKRSLQALREAKGMFLPSISIEARYSRAGGHSGEQFHYTGGLYQPVEA
jgi:outer membrane protein TolC